MEDGNQRTRSLEQGRNDDQQNESRMSRDGGIDINATLLGESNVTELMHKLSINSLVIGLTAATAGLNPARLIGQLASSWYSRMNGFNGNVLDETSVTLPSALIKQYNWDDIKSKSQDFVKEFIPIAEIVDEPDEDSAVQAEARRKDILMRLRSLKESKAKETSRANPVTPDSSEIGNLNEVGGYYDLAPADADGPDPKHEFEIDYALNKGRKQPKGMRVKGVIGESIARHKAMKEAGEVNISREEAERKKRNERRRKRAEAKRRAEAALRKMKKEDNNDTENGNDE